MPSDEERIIRLLTDSHHRAILTILNDAARELPLAELADRLVANEATVFESADYERELERVIVSLHHNHLPKLAEAGLVEYDRNESVVSYENFSAVDPSGWTSRWSTNCWRGSVPGTESTRTRWVCSRGGNA